MRIGVEPDSPHNRTGRQTTQPTLARRLSVLDATLIVVGGVIGSAIFITPADVARQVANPILVLLLWTVAGLVALLAGFAFAELGAMFPEAGGQYIYIREAYGSFVAFIYGWILFTAGNSGGLAAVAIGFALFFGRIIPAASGEAVLYTHTFPHDITWHLTRGSLVAIFFIILLTMVNIRGVKAAAILQNFTGFLTLVAVGLMVALGLTFGHGSWSHFAPSSSTPFWPSLPAIAIAFVALFWTYDGWNIISWAAGEIKDAKRNLPRAMIWGILLVIVTYVSANIVYVYALPMTRIARQSTLAEAAVSTLFTPAMGRLVSLVIVVACFGSMSVVILGGARVYYAMAKDGVFFPSMQKLHPRWKTPVVSLVVQCVWVCVLTASGGYEALYTCFTFMMTLTYVFTVAAVFILRHSRPDIPRPYRCLGYPWLPALYLLVGTIFVLTTLFARPLESVVGLLLALPGVPAYFYWRRSTARRAETG
ncbi:MAG: APC family permease [Candidatus Acidiferrales bacterium]